MAKVLVTAHLGRHFRIFGQSDYKVLLNMGHEVHIAANFNEEIDKFDNPNVIKHQIDFDRNPFSIQNLKALKQLKKLFRKEDFELIHCQSPSGGAITRLASKETRKRGTKVLYTAHGLHFFEGAPKKNWIMYYNFEKFFGKYTDCIITINNEDFYLAKNKLKINNVEHVHGVGIDLNKFKPQTKNRKLELRNKYGYNENEYILIYVGELSYRKNQDMIIEAMKRLNSKINNIKLLLVGNGILESKYKEKVIKYGLEQQIDFLGYRKDIVDLMALSDLAISTSKQEGLPVNIMEAMATGLPLVVTNCRGNRDLIKHKQNGYVVEINDLSSFEKYIEDIQESKEITSKFSTNNLEDIKNYSTQNIEIEMTAIYSKYL
ncbi:glycosyltransferase family 4 protein [Paraclostridium bifermentans]|uniref:glycosyltransferase family 4 protein n=1 Tax=Paraclostridium TaxID=1849822 RepID=UPI001CC7187C|nr:MULTISPECIES: glycosyltransferase family 4 protein [Paraclostridium]MBZ6006057.1 glycosyltransferase family 4 protein [Paraclostridium bifermentans]MDU0298590.1 glycosyltransferase family 4 protein [Paraclostridium sp. MRS3W1]